MAISRTAPPFPVPECLKVEPENITIHFKLRDCEFMEFEETIDKSTATVYDLMWAVSKHHGETIYPDSVHIYTTESGLKQKSDDKKESGGKQESGAKQDSSELTDITQKISELIGIDTFYYDYDPVDGSLLIIPQNEKPI